MVSIFESIGLPLLHFHLGLRKPESVGYMRSIIKKIITSNEMYYVHWRGLALLHFLDSNKSPKGGAEIHQKHPIGSPTSDLPAVEPPVQNQTRVPANSHDSTENNFDARPTSLCSSEYLFGNGSERVGACLLKNAIGCSNSRDVTISKGHDERLVKKNHNIRGKKDDNIGRKKAQFCAFVCDTISDNEIRLYKSFYYHVFWMTHWHTASNYICNTLYCFQLQWAKKNKMEMCCF